MILKRQSARFGRVCSKSAEQFRYGTGYVRYLDGKEAKERKRSRMSVDRRERFRLGRQVRLADLHQNPYPLLKRLREGEPISWVPAVNGWFVTRRSDMLALLLDSDTFSVASAGSFLENTLGRTML